MTQKKPPIFKSSPPPPKDRPQAKPAHTTPEAKAFPNVGVTLRSYQNTTVSPPPRRPVIKLSRWRRIKSKITIKRTAIILALLVLIIGGWVGGKFAYNAHKIFGGNIFSILHTTKIKGEDRGRVNILLAGNSADDYGHAGADLTDSILILSVDTKNNTATMLSVPRDLWVQIPDQGHAKINYAYVAGQQNKFSESGFPNGGMGELEKIINTDFGLPIDYYALVNYNALRQAVDAVGGIDIVVQSPDKRGLYDPNIDYSTHGPLVKLSNGPHHLNGEQALDLARARGDSDYSYGFPQSDFNRTEHQRQMLVALKSKTVSAGVLANPAKLSSLADAIGGNVKTDMNLSEVRRLYDLIKPIDPNSIASLGLNDAGGKNLLSSYQSPDGQSALVPAAGIDEFSDIQRFIKQQTSSDPIARESAKIVLLNATDTSGLASKKRTTLQSKNLIVSDIADAKANQAVTTIIDNSGGKKPATKQLLMTQFAGSTVTVANPYKEIYDADFIILIGADQVPKPPTPKQ